MALPAFIVPRGNTYFYNIRIPIKSTSGMSNLRITYNGEFFDFLARNLFAIISYFLHISHTSTDGQFNTVTEHITSNVKARSLIQRRYTTEKQPAAQAPTFTLHALAYIYQRTLWGGNELANRKLDTLDVMYITS